MNELILDTTEFLSRIRNKIKKAMVEGRFTKEEADSAWPFYHHLEKAFSEARFLAYDNRR